MLPVVLDFGEDMTVDDLVKHGTNLVMSNSAKKNWREQSKSEADMMILQSTAALRRNILDGS